MKISDEVMKAKDVVSAEAAIKRINELIESGVFSTYTQICLIRAMTALSNEVVDND